MKIETVDANSLKPADWRAGHVLKPDLRTLAESILDYGWTAPLVCQTSTSTIIDGYHRWGIALNNRKVARRDQKMVPVLWKDVDDIEARIMHVKLNRGRGQLVPRYLSLLVKDILRSKRYDSQTLGSIFGMGVDELGLLMEGDLFKIKKIAEHEFNKAWVPYESNSSEKPVLERPPSPDK